MNVVLDIGTAPLRLALGVVLSEEPGVTVVGTDSETEGLLALTRTAHPDLVLLEWDLSGSPTEAVLAATQTLSRQLPILVLARDPTLRLAALTAGACAFMQRPSRHAVGGPASGARHAASALTLITSTQR